MFDPTEHPHRHLNPLTGDWVFISPHRTRRPWRGQVEKPPADARPTCDPGCYLCPGNSRASGVVNPQYSATFVFQNDFAALLPLSPANEDDGHRLLRSTVQTGTCRVVCYSPRHDLTLTEMAVADVRAVVDVWASQLEELGQQYGWVQIFENKGALMGASNLHPHGQLWAQSQVPNEPAREDHRQHAYVDKHGTLLLFEYGQLELERGERIVIENEDWLVAVPNWAIWPFETLLLPRRHVLRMPELSASERHSLAAFLKRLLTRYDNLFETSFPYSMGWHGAPTTQADFSHWQLHAHFYPPLLRSATVKKFMVGYEMLAEPQRDITAEVAAERLRNLPDIHFKQRQAEL